MGELMATRISKNDGVSGQGLIDLLRKKASRREIDSNFIGLKRSSALSDLDNPTKSLDNILKGISDLETAEKAQYGGPFNSVDWDVTRDFIDEQINKDYLSQLSGVSYLNNASVSPRIRIQDQISLLNSFYGEGSFPRLHSGPDAQFYRSPQPQHIGYIKFSFNSGNGSVSVDSLQAPDGLTNLDPGSILSGQTVTVLDLEEYTSVSGITTSITGTGISLKLVSPSTWMVNEGLSNLTTIQNSVNGSANFLALRFKLIRPYSSLYPPLWFTESPSDSEETGIPGSADDLNPDTTSRVLQKIGNITLPLISKGYWYSKAYVDNRWTPGERSLIGEEPRIIQDSNMRWLSPPIPLKSQTGNWGIRWDGYLRITPGNYVFEVQTNVQVKIDLAMGSNKSWINVLDTRTSVKDGTEKYISNSSLSTDTLSSDFKQLIGSSWVGYVPITIRMYCGQTDKATPTAISPSEPNIFIKTTTINPARNFYSRSYGITLSGTENSWTVSSANLSQIIAILQDTAASVTYTIVGTGSGDVFYTPIPIFLTTNGTTVSSISTLGLTSGNYVLKISPFQGTDYVNNLSAMWKGRIASPSPTHKKYADMVDNSYTPDILKLPFDIRPEWWKVSSGNPYNQSLSPSSSNNPLDGFLPNTFQSTLKSLAAGVGLYGTGDGVTFSSRPSLICGEARYSPQDAKGSNYTGIRLVSNTLGEGGKLLITAVPINNSTYTDSDLLGANDLGGSPNHLTVGSNNLTSYIARLYLRTVALPSNLYNKYFLIADPTIASSSDDPTQFGLPPFSNSAWLSPIVIFVISVADDLAFTTNIRSLSAPLTLTLSKVTVNGKDLLSLSTTQTSILNGGSEVSLFSSKYIKFYTESGIAFQYSRVDTGEALTFADCLKLTYVNNVFQPSESEIPKPPADRVTPFGFDKPEFTNDLCYPPYSVNNPLISDTAVTDADLYSSPSGNYDVFWGDSTKSDLDGKILTLTERIEFQSYDNSAVQVLSTPVTMQSNYYTHKIRFDFPILPGTYDEDMLEHIGSGEKVKDSYYGFVNLNS